jgi:NTP pyrophosphatase (non-canonical NTP hydrolase)
MLAEECCELAQAALKFHRRVNPSTLEELAEEIADVELCIEQMKNHFAINDRVDFIKSLKLIRLNTILAEYLAL